MSDRYVRVDKWEEFKRLVNETKVRMLTRSSCLQYWACWNFNIKNREFTCLRLIIPAKNYYVYVDFAKGDRLMETGIPIHEDSTGTRSIEDQDIKEFLRKEFGEKLAVYSYWVT